MATLIADHQLINFDEWFALFSANPPPAIGKWRLLRGSDDPNRATDRARIDLSFHYRRIRSYRKVFQPKTEKLLSLLISRLREKKPAFRLKPVMGKLTTTGSRS